MGKFKEIHAELEYVIRMCKTMAVEVDEDDYDIFIKQICKRLEGIISDLPGNPDGVENNKRLIVQYNKDKSWTGEILIVDNEPTMIHQILRILDDNIKSEEKNIECFEIGRQIEFEVGARPVTILD